MTFDNTVPGKNNLSRLYQFFSISDGLKSPTTLGNIWCHTGRFALIFGEVDPAVLVNLAETCFAENQQCILTHTPAMVDVHAAMASKTLDADVWVRLLHWGLTTHTDRDFVVKVLSCFFFLRAAGHCAKVQEMSNEEAMSIWCAPFVRTVCQ